MNNEISFGIGCFHFGVKEQPPFKFEASEYTKQLVAALESISNINNIDIDYDDIFENYSTNITEELCNINKGYGFFPAPQFMRIEFDVYIPFRIQEQLIFQYGTKQRGQKLQPLETFTEKFKVFINYTYYFPVTFVEPIDPSAQSTPSNAVEIVRNFLKHEFESSKINYIQFGCLGPSPFHADCYIYQEDAGSNSKESALFRVNRCAMQGYDIIKFYYNPSYFERLHDAKKEVMLGIQIELGFFYNLKQLEVVKMDEWEQITDLVDQLIATQRTGNIMSIIEKPFKRWKLINEAVTSLAQFKSKGVSLENFIQQSYRNIFNDTEEHNFQYYIDNEIENRSTYPTNEIYQLFSFFENRSLKRAEMLIVLIAAIIGGGIGALLTMLVSQ